MQRTSEDPTQFIITVHPHDNSKPRRFRTQKMISSIGAERLRGRGTRVFEAIEIDENGAEKGPVVVLKDTWIDHDRPREGDILAQLHDEANPEDKKLVEKHFLTTVCHGDVWTKSGVLDDTQRGLLHGFEPTPGSVFTLQQQYLLASNAQFPCGFEDRGATQLGLLTQDTLSYCFLGEGRNHRSPYQPH
jgi:Fungal protein kinase